MSTLDGSIWYGVQIGVLVAIDRAYPQLDLTSLLNANGQALAAQDGQDADGCAGAATNEPGGNASRVHDLPQLARAGRRAPRSRACWTSSTWRRRPRSRPHPRSSTTPSTTSSPTSSPSTSWSPTTAPTARPSTTTATRPAGSHVGGLDRLLAARPPVPGEPLRRPTCAQHMPAGDAPAVRPGSPTAGLAGASTGDVAHVDLPGRPSRPSGGRCTRPPLWYTRPA